MCLSLFAVLPSLAEGQALDYDLKVAKVSEVTDLEFSEISGLPLEQLVQLTILDGDQKGEKVYTNNTIPDNQAYSIVAEEGKKYIVAVDSETKEIFITDFYRQPSIIFLIALFFVLLVLIGGMRGFKAIISLIIAGLSILYILIPAIQAGFNPVLAGVLVSAIATASTMLLIAGWTKKSLAATIGTTGGVTVAGILAIAIIKIAPLSGLSSSEARILMGNLAESASSFDFQGVLAAGVLIASLGAAMDVAISIASAAQEIYLTNTEQSSSSLFNHCMNVGKDIMGTMTNTLILAYAGSAIPLLLLLISEPPAKILNMEIIATEITAAVVGSIGLLLSIPITAFASTTLLKSEKTK